MTRSLRQDPNSSPGRRARGGPKASRAPDQIQRRTRQGPEGRPGPEGQPRHEAQQRPEGQPRPQAQDREHQDDRGRRSGHDHPAPASCIASSVANGRRDMRLKSRHGVGTRQQLVAGQSRLPRLHRPARQFFRARLWLLRRPAGILGSSLARGAYLPLFFLDYEVRDYREYGLPDPPDGCRWVWVNRGVVLVDQSDGYIVDEIDNVW